MEEKKAIVFDIGRFRNTDGPGIRTILFFKGCPLRCLWCSNPFGFSPAPQLAVNPVKCTGCGKCVPVCPQGRNTLVPGEKNPGGFFRLPRGAGPVYRCVPAGPG